MSRMHVKATQIKESWPVAVGHSSGQVGQSKRRAGGMATGRTQALSDAEDAELALVELCKSSSLMTEKAKVELLSALEHAEARDEVVLSFIDDIEKTVELAASDAGERVKYLAACRQMKKRWEVFLALMMIPEDHEPELSDMPKFNAFMYTHRQTRSVAGRQGLGDSVAEMAQYILAQVRTGDAVEPSERAALRCDARERIPDR